MTTPQNFYSEQLSLIEGRVHLRQLLLTHSVKTGLFKLTSGKESDFYVDVKKTSLHPEGAYWIGRLFSERLQHHPEIKAVGGPTLGADPIISATSLVSLLLGKKLNGFIVRKEAKGHGTNAWIEGPTIEKHTPVAVVEDVLTTGGSALKAIDKIKSAGLDVRIVLVVVDRQEGGIEALQSEGLCVEALFTKSELR